jgi:hypothetical protein
MYAKSLVFGFVMLLSFLPVVSNAQSWTDTNSLANLDTSAAGNGSAVVISKEESNIPGYVHMKYAFLDQNCGPQIVDYYGPRINPSEQQQVDQRMCTEIAMNSRDGD